MNKTYNWAILGAGNIAGTFAEDLKLLPNANLYGIGSKSAIRAEKFAKDFHIPHFYGSYQALVEDPNIDIIYIASRHCGHYPDTLLCLNHGKHVLCEKPIAMNGAQFEKMAALARLKGLFLMEALWTRFLPSFIKCKNMIDEGAIGELRIIESDFCINKPFDPKSRVYNPLLGGGSLLDIGIYPVFCALETGSTVADIKASAQLNKEGVDTLCSILLSHSSGEHSILLSTINAPGRNETLFHGSKGLLRINKSWHTPTSLDLIHPGGSTEHFSFEKPGHGYQYEAAEVMQCLDNGHTESPLWPLEKSRQLTALLDTVRNQTGIIYPAEIEAC